MAEHSKSVSMVGHLSTSLAAGGSFVQNGYNGSMIIGELNPLDGRRVWTGSSGGYLTTVVNLPAGVAGKSLKLRWRMGSGLTWAVQVGALIRSASSTTFSFALRERIQRPA